MDESEITIYANWRRESLSAAILGAFVAVGIEGLVTETRIAVSVVLLLVFGPLVVLAARRAARRGPVLVLGKDAVKDPRRGLAIRWENVEDARVTEVPGAFGTYHQLQLSGSTSFGVTRSRERHDEKHDTIHLALLDRLSLPWEQIVEEVERRLPATTALHGANAVNGCPTAPT